jgi:hypothetical protein
MVMEASQRLEILFSGAPEPERAANEDRLVAARSVELVHCLNGDVRRESFADHSSFAEVDHVRGHVATVDIEACAKKREQQPASAAADIKCRLPVIFDVALEVANLVYPEVVVELRPPLGD